MLFIKEHNGYCDFCGGYRGKFIRTNKEGSTERDLCVECAKKACELFNVIPNCSSSISFMLTALAKRLFDKDTKTLIKAGYLNNDLSLTQAGEAELLAVMMSAHKAELVTAAEEKLVEDKEASK